MSKSGICCTLLLLGTLIEAKAQGWRGIVPLHSTCEDAKRVFNLSKCESSKVEFEDFTVSINFSAGPCTSEWDVPIGTVLTLDVWPRKNLKVADLHIDRTKYSKNLKRALQKKLQLFNIEEGVTIDLFEDGRVEHIFYGPSTKDRHLHCGSRAFNAGATERGSQLFDEYGFIPFAEEQSRLDEFANTLSGWSGTRGYIIVYPGGGIALEQAESRASRAKSYLDQKPELRDRIITVIGGNRAEARVELFINVQNGSPPVPTPPRDSRPR